MSDPEEPETGSTRPYLIRAIYQWALDQGLTPQVMVDVTLDDVMVPVGYAKDGRIVLNLHPGSVRALEISNEFLMFSARFSGRPEDISIPVEAVLAVYARENGQGIVFQSDGTGVTPPSPPGKGPSGKDSSDSRGTANDSSKSISATKSGSHLKVVK